MADSRRDPDIVEFVLPDCCRWNYLRGDSLGLLALYVMRYVRFAVNLRSPMSLDETAADLPLNS